MKLRIILYIIFSSCSYSHVLSQSFSHENISYGPTVQPLKELTKKDSTRLNMHGISIEALGRNYIYYSLGYEYISYKRKNGFGFSTNFSYHLKYAPASNKKLLYNALFFGLGGIYEFGKKIGFRTNLNAGLRIIPEMYTNKFDNAQIIEADRPGLYYFITSFGIGPFYRTENFKWQFIPQFYLLYQISEHENANVNNYKTYTTIPWFGISIKYNFQQKNN